MDLIAIGHTVSVWFLPVILAITLHEAAHAVAADKLGDPTARALGRVSLNPVKHIDPMGTLLLPAMLLLVRAPFLFGWAKPVPVDLRRLNNPKRDMALVAAAGPLCNMIQAVIAGWLFMTLSFMPADVANWVRENLQNAILINLVLAAFNLFPLPPLDGGRIMVGLLPTDLAVKFAKLERYGFIILLGLLFVVPLVTAQLGFTFHPIAMVIWPVVEALGSVVVALTPLQGLGG